MLFGVVEGKGMRLEEGGIHLALFDKFCGKILVQVAVMNDKILPHAWDAVERVHIAAVFGMTAFAVLAGTAHRAVFDRNGVSWGIAMNEFPAFHDFC